MCGFMYCQYMFLLLNTFRFVFLRLIWFSYMFVFYVLYAVMGYITLKYHVILSMDDPVECIG